MSIRIATIAGIPIRLHFTFVLVVLWIGVVAAETGVLKAAGLIGAIFLCVVLHELGHALTAKAYGIRTRDITLYPIGGVAMLLDRAKPKQEFWIALAGPLVNVLIALGMAPIVLSTDGALPNLGTPLDKLSFQSAIFAVNVILPVFNMIPAFPMDGGRVLRAGLAMFMNERRATRVAGTIGQSLAMAGFVAAVITGHVLIMLIAVFVFLGAAQEVHSSIGQSLMEGRTVSDAMLTQFECVSHSDTIGDAVNLLLAGSQQDFPVSHGEEVLGVLTRSDIVRAVSSGKSDAYVAEFMNREVARLDSRDPLGSALQAFSSTGNAPILVMSEGRMVGLLTAENLSEFVLLERAKPGNA